ncbi:MAG: potassium-transporting ATPase subunit KdpC [Nitrospira sp. CR2.1]|nr:potassium-transporting ATPase subunit KdpC [Nitrospira sp. CR2.1]MBA5875844.1 potassium-transporting ATPase subunit KdpC [Nitrospira sp. CR1.2]
MKVQLKPALTMFLALTVLTGVAYPLAVTGLAQMLFPYEANGSMIVRNGKTIGSVLIGQPFDAPRYFWGRPSATASFPYNAAASSGSNLGPTNPALADAFKMRVAALRAADPVGNAAIPVDLVTTSGSGLDPHISPAAAAYQAKRVARARGLDMAKVQRLVEEHTEGRQFGLLGERRVNVLLLNLALDEMRK